MLPLAWLTPSGRCRTSSPYPLPARVPIHHRSCGKRRSASCTLVAEAAPALSPFGGNIRCPLGRAALNADGITTRFKARAQALNKSRLLRGPHGACSPLGQRRGEDGNSRSGRERLSRNGPIGRSDIERPQELRRDVRFPCKSCFRLPAVFHSDPMPTLARRATRKPAARPLGVPRRQENRLPGGQVGSETTGARCRGP